MMKRFCLATARGNAFLVTKTDEQATRGLGVSVSRT